MKKFFMAVLIAVVGISLSISDAEARRMGGGKSFGKQSYSAQRQATNPPAAVPAKPAAAPGATGAAAAAKPSPWKGILGGALLGLGLGALLSHLGIGGALASMIGTILTFALIAVAIMFLVRMFKNKSSPATAGGAPSWNQNMQGSATPEIGSQLQKRAADDSFGSGLNNGGAAPVMADVPAYGIPADFDVNGFVRNAKTYFIRLQAAWDRGDVNDIREFTTPEMFAELRMQLQERGQEANVTDVVSLDAEVLGVETIGDEYLVSVKFQGFVKEDAAASPEQFREIWNLSKPVSGQGGWLLAGIQQLS